MEFSDHYVAYFDILGYKDFFSANPDKAIDFVMEIESAIQKTISTLQNIHNSPITQMMENEKITHRIFSDNILLCLPVTNLSYEKVRLLTFLTVVADIQRGFVNEFGLFVRGAITKGKFLITDNSIHGQALIEAVNLESSAEFPRIIIAENITKTIFAPFFSEAEQKEIDTFSEKIKKEILLTPKESQKQQFYLEQLEREFALRKWYIVLTFLDTDKNCVLDYLYNADIKEIYPQAFEHIDEILKIFAEMNKISDIEQLKQGLSLNPIAQTKFFLQKHKEQLTKKLIQYGTI